MLPAFYTSKRKVKHHKFNSDCKTNCNFTSKMILHPNHFIQFSYILLPLATGIAIPFAGTWFAAGILLSGMVLMFNVYFWIRIVDYVIQHVANGASLKGLQLFVFMKLFVLITCVAICGFVFPIMSVIFGNSVIVLSVLLPSFYSAFKGSYTSTQIGAQ